MKKYNRMRATKEMSRPRSLLGTLVEILCVLVTMFILLVTIFEVQVHLLALVPVLALLCILRFISNLRAGEPFPFLMWTSLFISGCCILYVYLGHYVF